MRRSRKWWPLWGCLVAGSIIAFGAVHFLRNRVHANGLYIHAFGSGWQGIAVLGTPGYGMTVPLTPTVTLGPQSHMLRVPALIGSAHELWVRFADGTAARVIFSHPEIGNGHRRDIYVIPNAVKDSVHIREVVDGHVTVFSGDLTAAKARMPIPPVQAWL